MNLQRFIPDNSGLCIRRINDHLFMIYTRDGEPAMLLNIRGRDHVLAFIFNSKAAESDLISIPDSIMGHIPFKKRERRFDTNSVVYEWKARY